MRWERVGKKRECDSLPDGHYSQNYVLILGLYSTNATDVMFAGRSALEENTAVSCPLICRIEP